MMRIAVIGSGIAGLAACRALAGRAQVVLFEAASRPGGHVATVDVPNGPPVDLGFIVFNEARYPHFTRMLAELGVASRASDMGFSVFRPDGGLELGSHDLGAVFAQRRNLLRPAHYRRLAAMLRFLRRAERDLARGAARDLTLDAYLDRSGAGASVRAELVEPLASALWSLAPDRVGAFPAESFLRFLHQHDMLRPLVSPRWRTVVGGSRAYVEALLHRLPVELRLDTPVIRISRGDVGPMVDDEPFDRVILATQADTSLTLLAQPSEAQRAVLGAIRFSDNEAWLHTDASVMPRARAAWASWNCPIEPDRSRAGVTYWMNRLQGLPGPTDYFVTLNPARPIAPGAVLHRQRFAHPIFDAAAIRAQAGLAAVQGSGGVYLCGAWTGWGFHEDGMRSGLAAAARVLATAHREAA
ncbi:MAG TPA: FAD-dependent oxidoreductase [Kofleriaceae bacterium]|nr:FAD-dependent oxidoreductase [Kofleriaceae bacterium]